MKQTEKRALWSLLLLLTLTGLIYWYFKKLYVSDDPFAISNHPLQGWMMKGHLFVAPWFVFLMGWISLSHVRPRYRSKSTRGQKTGILNFVLLMLCIFTGYYLQLLTTKNISLITAWAHVITGGVAIVWIWIHQIKTKR